MDWNDASAPTGLFEKREEREELKEGKKEEERRVGEERKRERRMKGKNLTFLLPPPFPQLSGPTQEE